MQIKIFTILLIIPLMFFARACGQNEPDSLMKGEEKKEERKTDTMATNKKYNIQKSEAEWKEQLTDEEYRILRQKGTEPPFSGELLNVNEKGTYVCAACGEPLFSSETKFECGSGWPSFYEAIEEGKIEEETDTRYGMRRTEILCANCGGHLGHVFPDGPKPTGLRYCTNSAALDFVKD